ncbi:MAG: hypothetical protein JXB48_21155 [Candidatus Latescibacteria bacterium]|nr:hypothetical protein [Candidatus Latescibacterota bacterium]
MAIKTEDAFDMEEIISSEDAFGEEMAHLEGGGGETGQIKKQTGVDKFLRSIYPSAMESIDKLRENPTPGNKAKTIALAAPRVFFDVAGIPTRAIAKTRGMPMSDPGSYFLKPEVNRLNEYIAKKNPGKPTEPTQIPYGGSSDYTNSDPLAPVRLYTEVVGGTLSDPTLIGGLLKKSAGKAFQAGGKRIEKSVIGKGSKAILRDQGVSLDKAAEGALKHGLGGDMQHVITKGQEIADGLEEQISNLTKNYTGPKKVNVEYQFYKARKYIDDHPELFITDKKEVLNAIDDIEKNFDSYGITGNIDVDQAQQLKRALKVKGIPGQSSPASQDAVFGVRMAFADAVREVVPQIDKYNGVYREIMPALKLAANRLPTEQARDLIGLGTLGASGFGALITGGSSVVPRFTSAAISNLIYQGTKSGKVAQGLYNIGKGIQSLPSRYPIGGAGTGFQSHLDNIKRRTP